MRASQWRVEDWATSLGALLTGKAPESYSRLSEEDAVNYNELKTTLLKRYNLTEEGYQKKFRQRKTEPDETLEQFIFREKTHLEKWVDMSQTDRTYEGLRDLFVKEQVIETCPKDLSTYLQERTPRNLDEMAKIGEKYLEARRRKLHQVRKTDVYNKKTPYQEQANDKSKNIPICYNCNEIGHISKDCKAPKKIHLNSD